MYTNVEIFNESIGYEIYFIKNSLKNLDKGEYLINRYGIVFKDHNYKTHLINISDSFGSNLIPSYIKENLIPLVFTSSFKIIDMFFEYIIKTNETSCPWQFSAKIQLLEEKLCSYQKLNNIGEAELNSIFYLYKNLTIYRNKLIHGMWGKIENEKMVFEMNGNKCEIEFEEVLAFANVSQIIGKVINSEEHSELIKAYVSTLHRELNVLGRLMGDDFTKFKEEFVFYYNIDYEINKLEEYVNVQIIREKVEKDLNAYRGGTPDKKFSSMFEIVVNNGTERWCIPSSKIDDGVKTIELKKYSNYLIRE